MLADENEQLGSTVTTIDKEKKEKDRKISQVKYTCNETRLKCMFKHFFPFIL